MLVFLELVPGGRSLAELVDSGELFPPLPSADYMSTLQVATPRAARPSPDEAVATRERLSLALQLARALEHVHRRGVVHCDVKSDNAMVYPVAAAAGGARHAEHALKLVDFGLAKIGEVVGEGAAASSRARFGGCTPVWASPEALRLQRASRADPILARDHDLWSFALVAFELFVGDASLTAKERAKPTGQGLRGLRPSEHLGSLYEGDVRQWSSAAVREWAGEKPKLDKIAKSFEEHGVDGAALLRYAGDRPKLKADFKVTHGVAITLGMEMDRTVRRWPRPIPEDLVALLRKCVAVEPSERFESATPIVAELERLALAAHAAILDDGAAPAADGSACLPRALSAATTIALDDDEQADFHRDLGYALRAQLSRYGGGPLSRARTRSESEKTSPSGTTIRASTTPRHKGCTARSAATRTTKSRTSRTSSRRSTFGRATTRPRARATRSCSRPRRRGTARTTPRSRPGATTSRRCS